MEIQLPNQIDTKDLSEGDAMIIGLLYLICNKYGYDQWYNMNHGDWRKISFQPGATNPSVFSSVSATQREHIEFAKLDKNNILMKFKKVKPNGIGMGATVVGRKAFHIKELRSIQIWCYLMGLWHGENSIIAKSDAMIYHKTNQTSRHHLTYHNFKVG